MKRIRFFIFIIISPFLFYNCTTNLRDKSHHCGTTRVSDKLFVERYTVWSGGATDGDVVSVYITDSSIFRKYIISVKDHNWPDIIVNGDSIIVFTNNYCIPIQEKKLTFSLIHLRKEGIWE